MALFAAFVSNVLGISKEVAEEEGSAFLTDALDATNILTDEARAFAKKHFVEELTALLAGIAVLVIWKLALGEAAIKLAELPIMQKTVVRILEKVVSPGVAQKAVNITSRLIVSTAASKPAEIGVHKLFGCSNSLLQTIQGTSASPLATFQDLGYANGTSTLKMVFPNTAQVVSQYGGLTMANPYYETSKLIQARQ